MTAAVLGFLAGVLLERALARRRSREALEAFQIKAAEIEDAVAKLNRTLRPGTDSMGAARETVRLMRRLRRPA